LTDGSVVNGGTLSIGGSGEVEIQHGSGAGPNYGATFDSGLTVNNQGTITVDSGATLALIGNTTIVGATSSAAQISGSQTRGSINNSGAIELGTTAASATLNIGATVTLYGTGTLTLENGGDVVTGASGGGELFNYGTIAGAGSTDNSSGNGLTLANEAGGVIDADVSGQTLAINTGNTVENAGTLEATSGGILQIDDTVTNTGNGVIEVNGGTVDLANTNTSADSVTFTSSGGTLEIDASQSYAGTISGFGDGDTIILDDLRPAAAPVTDIWTPNNSGGGSLAVEGAGHTDTIQFAGSLSQNSFAISNDGTGSIVLSAPAQISLTGLDQNGNAVAGQAVTANVTSAGDTLSGFSYQWLAHGTTISGANQATYTPTAVGEILTVVVAFFDSAFPTAEQMTAVAGTVEGDFTWTGGGSTDDWSDAGNWNYGNVYPGELDNSDQVSIQPSNSVVVTYDSTETIQSLTTDIDATLDIASGSLTITSDTAQLLGPVEISSGGTLQLTNGSVDLVTNSGNFDVVGHNTLDLISTGVNNDGGTIAIYDGGDTSAGNVSTIALGNTTVTSGTILIGGSTDGDTNDVLSVSNGDSATLDGVTVTNDGTVNINGGATLTLDDGTTITGGTMMIAVGSTLSVESRSGATLDNVDVESSGNIKVDPILHSTVPLTLSGDTSITGGTLTIGSSGTLDLAASAVVTVDAILAGSGSINIGSGADLIVEGSPATSTGTINLQGGGDTLTIYDGALNASDQLVPAISGLTASDYVDFQGTVTSASYDSGDGVLTLLDDTSAVGYLTIGSGYAGDTWTTSTITVDGTTFTQIVDPPAAPVATSGDSGDTITLGGSNPPVQIDTGSGAVIELTGGVNFTLDGLSNDAVTFNEPTGALVLNDPESFTGQVSGFTGTAPDAAHSDTIDLVGINYNSSGFAETYNSATGLLTITDGTNSASITFDDFNATLDFASDGNSGTLITDPPPASGNEISALSTTTADGADGNLTFADSHSSDTLIASFTPDGTNYLGSFSLNQATVSDGHGAVSWEFDFDNQQVTLQQNQTLTQSYNVSVADAQTPSQNLNQTVSVTVGGPGNDNFVFAPGIGADTLTNFKPQQDTIELDHFTNVQNVQELESLVTNDAHGDAVINLGHSDSITLNGVTDAQLQQVIQAGHVLLH